MRRHLVIVALGLLPAWAASAAELPTRKAGLWDLKMTFEGRNVPPQTIQHCTDPATDKLMTANFGALGREQCSQRDIQVSGSTITMDSVCKFGAVTSTSHAVVSGDFNRAYTVKVTSRREGGPAAAGGETNMTIEATWVGPCKSDQKAGDMVLPGGQKFNVRDLQNRPGGPGGPGGPPTPGQRK